MNIGDKVRIKGYKDIGVIAYKVNSTKALENRWCIHFPDKTLCDSNESDLILITENIFEGAKFGDKFVTKNNELAIFSRQIEDDIFELMLDGGHLFIYDENGWYMGKSENDLDNIVEKYTETIDEKELNKLAIECTPRLMIEENDGDNEFQWGFKVGYRKAKEK